MSETIERDTPDDGFEASLHRARLACGAMLFVPPVLAAVTGVIISIGGAPHESPVIVATLAIVGLTIMCSPGLVREELARRVIGRHLAAAPGTATVESAYAGFANAQIVAFAIAATGAVFGFIASALMTAWTPLLVGSAVSYAMWGALWPRPAVWDRWTWQARLRRERTEPPADG